MVYSQETLQELSPEEIEQLENDDVNMEQYYQEKEDGFLSVLKNALLKKERKKEQKQKRVFLLPGEKFKRFVFTTP